MPNVRKLFLPDPNHLIFDIDLTGADAAVAAKECGGAYWADVKAGKKINVDILEYIYPEVYKRWRDTPPDPIGKEGFRDSVREPAYTKCKNMHYGSIYVGSAKGISASAAIPLYLVQKMQPWFFAKYPEIKHWHERVQSNLWSIQRGVSNAFGYSITYFDRLDKLLPEAVNWICQSTVAIVCQRGSLIIAREFPDINSRLQVHDSLVPQVRVRGAAERLEALRRRLDTGIPVPYEPEALHIPWGMKVSNKSWGHCIPVKEFFERKAT